MKIFRCVVPVLLSFLTAAAVASDGVDDAVRLVQHEWEVTSYQSPASEKNARWEKLAAKAHTVTEQYPGRAEPLIWEGIVLSSWAGDKGGLGALSLVKEAKSLYEKAMAIDPSALEGSAYNSLGVLYYKVPGWPLGFGDKNKARDLLEKALTLNPQGIDPNYFYGEYSFEIGKKDQAKRYLEKALEAPARPGRHIADTGRKEEIKALLSRIKTASM